MSVERRDRHAHLADLALGARVVGVEPICVGRSKAHDRPVWPASSRNLKRSLVASAVPNPAYWRIVHSRPRYMVACTPRV